MGDSATSFYVELRPISEQTVSEAIKVVGKSLEYFAANGREVKVAMAEFETWVKSVSHGRSPVFVGFNAAFDWAFTNWYFHTYLGRNPFGIGPIDIKSYFMGLKGASWEDTRSSRIRRCLRVRRSRRTMHLMTRDHRPRCLRGCFDTRKGVNRKTDDGIRAHETTMKLVSSEEHREYN